MPTLFTEEVEAGTKAILEVKVNKSKYSEQIISNSIRKFFYLRSSYTIPCFLLRTLAVRTSTSRDWPEFFFVPEHVNMEQAVELVKKPRYSNWVRQK